VIGPKDATLADVTAAYEDLGDAHYQADEVGDHAAEWRAQRDLDATTGRVAARAGISHAQVQGHALAEGPVQGPAAPTCGDLIWATGNSRATLDDPHATAAERLDALEAEAGVYEAAKHLGVEGASPEAYQAELAGTAGLAMGMEADPDRVSRAEWAAYIPSPEPEAGL
jgi:hypothetical protein